MCFFLEKKREAIKLPTGMDIIIGVMNAIPTNPYLFLILINRLTFFENTCFFFFLLK